MWCNASNGATHDRTVLCDACKECKLDDRVVAHSFFAVAGNLGETLVESLPVHLTWSQSVQPEVSGTEAADNQRRVKQKILHSCFREECGL